jgi:tetratricopeptide (TPR) repeat protein
MFRKYLSPLLAVGILTLTATLASAQTGELRGHVTLKQADGTTVPLAGAVIDIFRTDMTGKWDVKTDKKGAFVYAGLPYVGKYLVGVSGPGARPDFQPDIRVGRDIDYKFDLEPGDGRRLTLAEINSLTKGSGGSSGGAPAGESSADKARRAEVEAKNKEILESNKKAEESNKILSEKFTEGNTALTAGEKANGSTPPNYAEAEKLFTQAISAYDAGIAADPTHPGAPTLMTNKSQALMDRAVARYNKTITSEEYKTAIKSGGGAALLDPAKKDWKDAAETSNKAIDLLKGQTAPTDAAAASNFNRNKYFALLVRAQAMNKVVTKVDPTQVDVGITAYDEYLAAETDAAKKTKAQKDYAKMLFDANSYDKAKQAYDKILAENPDDPDALQNLGLVLYNLGFVKEAEGKKDEAKANYQEAANYLARFVEKAPDGQLKSEAQDVLKNLKEQQNVQAEKTATPPRRRRP